MIQKFDSLSEAHQAFGLAPLLHPLISMIPRAVVAKVESSEAHVLSFYKVSYKPKLGGRLRYGQGYYDFDEGGLMFASPNQIIGGNRDEDGHPAGCSLYTLLIHPDFLLGYPLAKKIRQYGFFSYSTNEALHLSEAERTTILGIFDLIEQELSSRIDDLSQDVVIAQIELLLNYANRYYKRQFITRKAVNNEVLQKLEEVLDSYFGEEVSLSKGIPTVQYLASRVNLSPSYLSDLLRSLMGRNAQQYIHDKLIEKAKEQLSTTSLSVSEVAYALGFEHSQSFSKLFKKKTSLSPLEFRRGFN